MNEVLCPACGAPVAFRSAASAMAVCGFCRSTLVRDADAVRNIGRMAEVLEDYSPIQVGTSGTVDGVGFTVVGRLQLRYPAGFWNEWYVLDDRGDGGWLSDASGQYAFTRELAASERPTVAWPAFEQVAPGGVLDVGVAPDGGRLVFVASDVRTARCVAGQGELPFAVGAGYETRVADFRRGDAFMTLDWSDEAAATAASRASPSFGDASLQVATGAPASNGPARDVAVPDRPATPGAPPRREPVVYRGRAVTLDGLQAQLLRDPQQIADTAGRLKGRVTNLECPSCGASIAFAPGATGHLVCQSCHASLDATGPVAEVVAASRRVDAVPTSIALGATATIASVPYTVIGLMRRAEIDDAGSEWTEYLLYGQQAGFTWLVETADGWSRATVLDRWPYRVRADVALLDGVSYGWQFDYRAVVKYAAGAFNWRVAVGDVVAVTEFASGPARLAAESDVAELTWSRSVPVAPSELAAWFGPRVATPAARVAPSSVPMPAGGYRRIAKWLTILLLVVNAIPVLFSPGRALWIVLFAIAGLYVPAWFLDRGADAR